MSLGSRGTHASDLFIFESSRSAGPTNGPLGPLKVTPAVQRHSIKKLGRCMRVAPLALRKILEARQTRSPDQTGYNPMVAPSESAIKVS